MKIPSLFILILLFHSFAVGQEDLNGYDQEGKRHGPWKVSFEGSDQVKFQGTFSHGKEIDTFRYYQKGHGAHPAAVLVFKEDQTAEAIYFSQQGYIISKGALRKKHREGTWIYFHKGSTDTMMVEQYQKGQLQGLQATFFPNGEPAEKTWYKAGKKHGKSKLFTASGHLSQELTYQKGKRHGRALYFDKDGQKLREGSYQEDQRTGQWIFYKNGKQGRKKTY